MGQHWEECGATLNLAQKHGAFIIFQVLEATFVSSLLMFGGSVPHNKPGWFWDEETRRVRPLYGLPTSLSSRLPTKPQAKLRFPIASQQKQLPFPFNYQKGF